MRTRSTAGISLQSSATPSALGPVCVPSLPFPVRLGIVSSSPILLKNSSLAAATKRDSIDFTRIDGGGDDGRAFRIAGSVFLPV